MVGLLVIVRSYMFVESFVHHLNGSLNLPGHINKAEVDEETRSFQDHPVAHGCSIVQLDLVKLVCKKLRSYLCLRTK
jgi:hypothetical protein